MTNVTKFPHKSLTDRELEKIPAELVEPMRRMHNFCEELGASDDAVYSVRRFDFATQRLSEVQSEFWNELVHPSEEEYFNNATGFLVERDGDNFKAASTDVDAHVQKLVDAKIWNKPKPDEPA